MLRHLIKKSGSKVGAGFFSVRELRSVNKSDKNSILTIERGNSVKKFKLPINLVNEEKKFILKGKSSNLANNFDTDTDPESLIKNEEDLDLYSVNEHLYHEKIVDEDIRKKRKTKISIIKKKINKLEGLDEKNVNLLTWDAKEQIKHLNMTDPETWTPERISESFPVTLKSCKKLLKSKWTPLTLDDLERHDEKVIQNWKMLKEMEKNPNSAGPAINIYREYKKINKLNLLKNATGLPEVNFERNLKIFTDSYAVHESLLSEPGTFSKIIVNNDNFVKKVFGRDTEEVRNKKSCEKSKTSDVDLFNNHLMFTKNQLNKILAKIFSDDNNMKK